MCLSLQDTPPAHGDGDEEGELVVSLRTRLRSRVSPGCIAVLGILSTVSLQDPQTVLREKCRAKADCSKLAARLDDCNERVRSRIKTSENCHEEVVDLFHCVDHCVSSH